GEMGRNRRADDAGAKNDYIAARHKNLRRLDQPLRRPAVAGRAPQGFDLGCAFISRRNSRAIKAGTGICEFKRRQTVAMLCGVVVLISCACIWISCWSRLLPNTFAVPAVDELSAVPVPEDELELPVLLGAEVTEMLDPSL